MAIEKLIIKNKISLKEKVVNFKVNILKILTLPARKKFFLAKQFSIFCKKFYDEYNDADTGPDRGLYKIFDLVSKEKELLLIDVGANTGYISEYLQKNQENLEQYVLNHLKIIIKSSPANLEKYNLSSIKSFLYK